MPSNVDDTILFGSGVTRRYLAVGLTYIRLCSIRHFATWLSHRDLAQLVRLSLEAESLVFDIFYGVSDDKWNFWDIDHARTVIGYHPQDNAERYRE